MTIGWTTSFAEFWRETLSCHQGASRAEQRLTEVWCWISGLHFTVTGIGFLVLMGYGYLSNVKVRFVSLCYMAIVPPGYLSVLWDAR